MLARTLARHLYRPMLWLALAGALALGMLLLGVIRQARASGSKGLLLPNLVATAPDNASIETSYDEGGLRKENVPAELLLRFNGYIHNDGEGALDFRGERPAPVLHSTTSEKEVANREAELKKVGEEEKEGIEPKAPRELSEQTEAELTVPAMGVFQRLFETNAGAPTSGEEKKHNEENEKYLKREHKDEPSRAEMLYVNADGHHHWHLQHIAKYSLWNAAKTAEVAPSEKVGFCLEDSERVELEKVNKNGKRELTPENSVYSDEVAPYRHFCQRYIPYATSVYEGISPGWRDEYASDLGFQWVDVSDVLPGEYWLREEVNPEGKIIEEGRGEKAAFAAKPTIVPGFDALSQEVSTYVDEPVTITTTSMKWKEPGYPLGEPDYTIVSPPRHGTLEPIGGTGRFIYRPDAGYAGSDSFTFSASDPNSEFPRDPAVAPVTINVAATPGASYTPAPTPAPSVAISGVPREMIAGTSVQLSALVTNDSPDVTWSASAGTITPGGLYTAPSTPPAGAAVAIAARSPRGAEAHVTIAIRPVPASSSAPAATPSKACRTAPHTQIVCRPEAMLIGRKLIMTTRVSRAGHVRLSAYLGHRLLGGCAAKTPGNRSFTCRLTLGRSVRLSSRITIVASLRIGSGVISSTRPAAPVPEMKMVGPSGPPTTHALAGTASAGRASSWRFWCSPSMGM
jgi:hypothetical protein